MPDFPIYGRFGFKEEYIVLSHFAITLRGKTHIANGTSCQDYSGTATVFNKNLGMKMAIAAIADGVGSCKYSDDGSRIAVTSVLETLGNELSRLTNVSETTVPEIVKKSFVIALNRIKEESGSRNESLSSFDTTLTVAVLTEEGTCFLGHVGDDGAVALFTDGSYSMVTERMKGEYENEVIPLARKNYWAFSVLTEPIASIVLMTDGLLNEVVSPELFNNRVYYPLVKPIFENPMKTASDINYLKTWWEDYLQSDTFEEFDVIDDITLAVIQVPDLLEKVKPQEFDENEWNSETLKKNLEINEKLAERSGSKEKTNKSQAIQSDTAHSNQTSNIPKAQDSLANHSGLTHANSNIQRTNQGNAYLNSRNAHDVRIHNYTAPHGKNIVFGLSSRVIICALALLVIIGFVVSNRIGYNQGVIDGKKQGENALYISMEEERQKSFQQGFEEGKTMRPLEASNGSSALTVSLQELSIAANNIIISKGCNGPAIKSMKYMLKNKGWELKINDSFDDEMESAVKKFQIRNGLDPTGNIDIITYWSLLSQNSKGRNDMFNKDSFFTRIGK